MTNKWDNRFLNLAIHISEWSKDPSTKVGCVIVGPDREIRSTGYNGFPRGVADDSRLHDRENKYPIICHAEENAIMHAARIGVSLRECTAYTSLAPCTRCARSLIQVGLIRVVTFAKVVNRWQEDCTKAQAMLQEAGVSFETINGKTI